MRGCIQTSASLHDVILPWILITFKIKPFGNDFASIHLISWSKGAVEPKAIKSSTLVMRLPDDHPEGESFGWFYSPLVNSRASFAWVREVTL